MKKRIQKLATFFVALALLVGVFPFSAVMADTTGVPPEGPYSLNIHKYANKPDTDPEKLTPTGEEQTVSAEFVPVKGIEFTIWKVRPDANGVYPTDAALIDFTDDTQVELASKQVGNTGADGLLKFTIAKDNQGVYLVRETNSKGILAGSDQEIKFAAVAPFMVQVPMTKLSGAGAGETWLKDVHVYPKNQTMTPSKTVDGGNPKAVKPGDIVKWTIDVPLASDMSKIKQYDIFDTVDKELLTFDTTSVEVSTSSTKGGTQTAVPAANYTVTDDTNGKLTISFTQAGIAYLAARQGATPPDMYVRVKLSTIVTDAAAGISVDNGAGITFEDENGTVTEIIPETEKPFIYSGAIPVSKVFDENGTKTPLAGAKFSVATSEQNARDGVFITMADGSTEVSVTTDATGKAVILGIPFGKDGVKPEDVTVGAEGHATTFYLVETKAPDGYNKLQEPIAVTYKYTATEIDGVTYHYISDEIEIYNTKNFTLPLTGSTGIIISTVAGVLLISGAILTLLFRKKRQLKND